MDLTDPFQMRLKQSLVEEFSAKNLRDHIGMGICSHFHFIEFPYDLFVCKNIAQSRAGREYLGKTVGIYSVACFVEILDRRYYFPAITHLAVWIVFQNHNIILAA